MTATTPRPGATNINSIVYLMIQFPDSIVCWEGEPVFFEDDLVSCDFVYS